MKKKQKKLTYICFLAFLSLNYSPIKAQDTEQSSIKINTKFDFVPGDKLLFFDDFTNDFEGDFPSRWNTNTSGEIITIGDNQKWFEIKPGYNSFFIPDITDFPEEYTIEYDVMTSGVAKNITHLARLYLVFSNNNGFKNGRNNDPVFGFPFSMRGSRIVVNNKNDIDNEIDADLKEIINKQAHVSIAVNKKRLRFWVNDKKYIDIPRFFTEDNRTKYLKFNLKYFNEGRDRLFIKNIKIAKGGIDLRKELINKGHYSTNNILFDSGSSNIKLQSYGIIKQVSQVLKQDKTMQLKIIGHTDADGSEESNLVLSRERAESIKKALVNIHEIDANRLFTEGKGETTPTETNETPEGKAKNRRVEFIKE